MKRPWAVVPLFIVILILLALPRVVLLPRLTAELKGELAAALETAELDLTVEAPWGWELLMGRIPSLALTARDAGLEGVDVSQLNLEAEEILFQPWTLFTQHELVLTSFSSITGSLLVSESALNEAFWREVDPSRRLWLEISPQGLAVLGTVGIWNMDVSVRVLGDVVVEVENHPFYLDPATPEEGYDVGTMLREKYGREPEAIWARAEAEARKSGIDLDLSKQPRTFRTAKAHTIVRLAREKGTQHELANAIAAEYFLAHRPWRYC